jgi:hypothetical protein
MRNLDSHVGNLAVEYRRGRLAHLSAARHIRDPQTRSQCDNQNLNSCQILLDKTPATRLVLVVGDAAWNSHG